MHVFTCLVALVGSQRGTSIKEINSNLKGHRDMKLVRHMIKSCEAKKLLNRFDPT